MAGTKYIIPLFVLLAACGQPVSEDNNGYGWHYDESGATGLRARYYDSSSPRLETLEHVYAEVGACMGMADNMPPGPLVIFTTNIIGIEGDRKYGMGFLETKTILLDNTILFDLPGGFWTFRHELVHFFLHAQGFPTDANQRHESQLFTACTAP